MQIPRQHLVARIGMTSMKNLPSTTISFRAGDRPDDARSPLLNPAGASNYINTQHNVPCTSRGLAALYRGNCCPRSWPGPGTQRLTTREEIDLWVATSRFRLISARLKLGEASQYIRSTYGVPCSLASLEKMASTGGGPAFVKVSRYPMYEIDELDRWVESRTSRVKASTSDRS